MKDKINICFREVKHGKFKGDIDAVFLDPDFLDTPYRIMCYSRVGQHSTGDISYFRNSTKPAKKEDYAPLLKELQSIYEDYDLIVQDRFKLKK